MGRRAVLGHFCAQCRLDRLPRGLYDASERSSVSTCQTEGVLRLTAERFDVELPRCARGDELLKPGELAAIRLHLRNVAGKHDLTTVIACAFDHRKRMGPPGNAL